MYFWEQFIFWYFTVWLIEYASKLTWNVPGSRSIILFITCTTCKFFFVTTILEHQISVNFNWKADENMKWDGVRFTLLRVTFLHQSIFFFYTQTFFVIVKGGIRLVFDDVSNKRQSKIPYDNQFKLFNCFLGASLKLFLWNSICPNDWK